MSRLSDAWEAWLDSTGEDDGETNDELAEALVEETRAALDRALMEAAERLDNDD